MNDEDRGELTRDAFLDGRLKLWQPRRGYRAAIDPVLLAAFAPARSGQRALDLGCGVGAAVLCLGALTPELELHGLEAQPAYADLARRNAAANGISLCVHEGDLRRPPDALRALQFDLVLTNPPYHRAAAPRAADPGRDRALRETGTSLADWIDAALRRLAPGGTLALIHLAARLGEIIVAIGDRAGAIEILPVAPRAGQPAERILLHARKGSRTPLKLLAPFTMHEAASGIVGAGAYTDAARAVLRGESRLLPGRT